MKNKCILIVSFSLLLTFVFHTKAQYAGDTTIIDSGHYRSVFAETRNYRLKKLLRDLYCIEITSDRSQLILCGPLSLRGSLWPVEFIQATGSHGKIKK